MHNRHNITAWCEIYHKKQHTHTNTQPHRLGGEETVQAQLEASARIRSVRENKQLIENVFRESQLNVKQQRRPQRQHEIGCHCNRINEVCTEQQQQHETE